MMDLRFFFFFLASMPMLSTTVAQDNSSPAMAEAFFRRGLEAQNQKQYRDAIDFYSEAIERDENYAVAYYNRAMSYFAKEQYLKSAEDLDIFIRMRPKDREALERRANVAYLSEDYATAVNYYSRAIHIADAARLRANRGIALLDGGNPEKSQEDFAAALRLDSTFVEAWIGYGNAYLSMANYERAKAFFQEAIRMGGTDIRLYFNLGITLAYLDDLEGAIVQFDTVINQTNNVEARSQKAYCLYKLGDFEKAYVEANEAHNIDVRNASAYNTLALLQINEEKYDIAEKMFTEALVWAPKNAELRCGRGYTYYMQGRYLTALEDLNNALVLEPTYGEAYYIRAGIRLMLSDENGACSDYNKALELGYAPFTEEEGSAFCQKQKTPIKSTDAVDNNK